MHTKYTNREIWKVAYPILISLIMEQLIGMTDTAFMENMPGFFIEMWANAPELYAVSVSSPTGEVLPKVPYRSGGRQEFVFIFEQTRVSIDYRLTGRRQGNQLIYLRFSNAAQGIWTINVYPQSIVTGDYNMWLPMRNFTSGNVFFLRSNPNHTITVPGNAGQVIARAATMWQMVVCIWTRAGDLHFPVR